LANDFCLPLEPRQGFAPLEVLLCPQCNLAQLSVVVDPEILYSRYAYITSSSDTMQSHFAELCKNLRAESGAVEPVILEIGSNDGAFLRFALKHGFANAVGIDPAQNLKCSCPTIHGMFNSHTAEMALEALGGVKPDVIVARHVFCHVEDWHEFIRNLVKLCHEHTVVAIEVPYVGDLLERNEFDSIYHEHTSYLSVNAMSHLLSNSGLMMYQVHRYSIHGGSICLMIRKGEQKRFDYDVAVDAVAWEMFSERAEKNIKDLSELVTGLKIVDKIVAGFGASAKSTVWINACSFNKRHVAFVTDNTPAKIGRMVPGTDIPVVDESRMQEMDVDYMILWAWNYESEILAKMDWWRQKGGKFIIPIPTIRIV
jgi:C-methyltransferase C-terminal domain/Methyltransferase domain